MLKPDDSAAQSARKEAAALRRCVCGHVQAHHARVFVYDIPKCNWTGCGCPLYVEEA